ncbi:MAG: hypothetical protein RR336_11570, partial [Oscillospiraceae bacterium]
KRSATEWPNAQYNNRFTVIIAQFTAGFPVFLCKIAQKYRKSFGVLLTGFPTRGTITAQLDR